MCEKAPFGGGVFMACQDFEPLILSRVSRKVWQKQEIPVINHLTTHKQKFGLSHMWPELGSNPQRWDDEQFRALKISVLNHSATGAPFCLGDGQVVFLFLPSMSLAHHQMSEINLRDHKTQTRSAKVVIYIGAMKKEIRTAY